MLVTKLWPIRARLIGTSRGTFKLLKSDCQMASKDVILTKKITQLRVHLERAIRRVKIFHILQCMPATMCGGD